ncbi:MAG: hypothetical protein RLZZ15_687 [Verrucomicrobiota bacterium]|jgi:hypothetical protein
MKNRLVTVSLALCAALVALPLALTAQDAPKKKAPSGGGGGASVQRTSPHETISAYFGDRRGPRVTLTYGRPFSAKGGKGEARPIWGGLVPWDKADRLGADEATTLTTDATLVIGGKELPAGAYVLYIVPSQNGVSKLAFSSRLAKWGIPVDETKDVARFDLTKQALENSVDQLTITITPNGDKLEGALNIAWEKTKFSLPFTLKK